jgi:hypothetical protein
LLRPMYQMHSIYSSPLIPYFSSDS